MLCLFTKRLPKNRRNTRINSARFIVPDKKLKATRIEGRKVLNTFVKEILLIVLFLFLSRYPLATPHTYENKTDKPIDPSEHLIQLPSDIFLTSQTGNYFFSKFSSPSISIDLIIVL